MFPIRARAIDGAHMGFILLPSCQTPPYREQRSRRSVIDHPIPARRAQRPAPIHRSILNPSLDRPASLFPAQRKAISSNQILHLRTLLVRLHLLRNQAQLPRLAFRRAAPTPANAYRNDGRQLGPARLR